MCNACSPVFNDVSQQDAAANQLVEMLNQGALCLMVSIGHRIGLFDTLAELSSASSKTIAQQAGLNERYVREWLGALVTGGIVRYDAGLEQYQLQSEFANLLTHRASPDNIAVFSQYIPLLGQVEDHVINCFHVGGGVDYKYFPRFHEVMAEDSAQTVVSGLKTHILPLVEGLTDQLEAGIDVLDIGCGRGKALLAMAKQYPNSHFTGIDLSTEAIEQARTEAENARLTNVRFLIRDLSDFDTCSAPQSYDFVTSFDAIHDQARPQSVLNGIYRTLRSGGIYLMQDIKASSKLENNLEHPIAPLLYTLSCMHCMTVSLAQNGAGLGTMWGEELAIEMLQEAGFNQIAVEQLEHDFQNNFYIMHK